MAGAVTADAIRGQSERATPAEQRRLTFRLDQLAARVGSATPAVPRLLQDAMTLEVVAMNSSQHVPATWRPPRELEALLHPAGAFQHPRFVVADPDLTLNEKRAILASWASDACAVEAAPALRRAPGSENTVTVDEILEALRTLDKEAGPSVEKGAWARRQMRRQAIEIFRESKR